MTEFWQIGELAKETGLTVRTLHHYDEIGLLKPSSRTDSGYRLYRSSDVERLQQILSLRQLGFRLDQIRELLGGSKVSVQEIVHMQLDRLTEQMELHKNLEQKLRKLSIALASQKEISTERLLEIIEVMTKMEQHGFDPKFTDEEKARLEARREELGDEKIQEVEKEWPELISKMRVQMEKGAAHDDPGVQKLAMRWQELVQMFSGGDAQIESTLKEAYDQSPEFAAAMGLDQELFEYVENVISKL